MSYAPQDAMTDPRTPDARKWGITVTPAQVGPGQGCWRCLSVEGPVEWGGRVSTFVEVLGPDGRRVVGLRVRWFWNNGQSFKATEPKTGEPFAVDFPMTAGGNSYGVHIADGQPSDAVWGFGLGRFVPHHVFKVVFGWVEVGVPTEPEPQPPPVGDVTLREAIEQAQRWLDVAKGLL